MRQMNAEQLREILEQLKQQTDNLTLVTTEDVMNHLKKQLNEYR